MYALTQKSAVIVLNTRSSVLQWGGCKNFPDLEDWGIFFFVILPIRRGLTPFSRVPCSNNTAFWFKLCSATFWTPNVLSTNGCWLLQWEARQQLCPSQGILQVLGPVYRHRRKKIRSMTCALSAAASRHNVVFQWEHLRFLCSLVTSRLTPSTVVLVAPNDINTCIMQQANFFASFYIQFKFPAECVLFHSKLGLALLSNKPRCQSATLLKTFSPLFFVWFFSFHRSSPRIQPPSILGWKNRILIQNNAVKILRQITVDPKKSEIIWCRPK